jgi:hypothetical protein
MIAYLELRAGNQIQQLKVLFSHECGRRYCTHTDLHSYSILFLGTVLSARLGPVCSVLFL